MRRVSLAENYCKDIDGSATAATCGIGAACNDGEGTGFTCSCVAGYDGAPAYNIAAVCTGT